LCKGFRVIDNTGDDADYDDEVDDDDYEDVAFSKAV
jgi:hypothetical protein